MRNIVMLSIGFPGKLPGDDAGANALCAAAREPAAKQPR